MRPTSAAAKLLLVSLLVSPLANADCVVPYLEAGVTINRPALHVVTADFNGDGKPDVAGNDGSSAFVAINDGSAHFPVVVDLFAGTIKGSIVAGDFTGDGKLDVALAGSSTLVVVPGNGDGTFGTAIVNQLAQSPGGIGAAGFDAGATLDLVTFDAFTKDVTLFANDGTGHFTTLTTSTMRALPKTLAVGDLDGDGHADALVSYANDGKWDALYGRGDGTFEAPVVIRAWSNPLVIRLADLDNNNLADLVTIDMYGYAVTIRNLGGRAFGDPLYYSGAYTAFDITAAELTGDGNLDVAATPPYCFPRTWSGTGLGTLDWAWYNEANNCSFQSAPGALAAADFDGDGRTDIVQSRLGYNAATNVTTIYRNRCGDGTLLATTPSPTITVGQTVTITATMVPPSVASIFLGATGNATIEEGSTVLATAAFSNVAAATFNLSALPLGDHTLVVKFAGDRQYEPTQSAPLVVHVTNETTTTTLSVNPAQGTYGIYPQITARVTSSTGDTPTGPVRFTIDGVLQFSGNNAPVVSTGSDFTVGTHNYSAQFLGDATHPPSSGSMTYVIGKATPKLTTSQLQAVAGQDTTLYVSVDSTGSGAQRTGTVTGTLGSTTVPAQSLINSAALWNLGPLAAGRYELQLHYPGDANYNAVDATLLYVVFPSGSLSVDARGTANAITVLWRGSNGVYVSRRKPNQPWPAGFFAYPSRIEFDVEPETVYLYRVSPDGATQSDVDVGMRIGFTDDLLTPGMVIRAVHLQEVIRAANILRAAAGLPALTLTIAPGDVVSAAHVLVLRDGINQARVALGAYAFPFSGTIAAGAPVRAEELQQLREAVR